MAQDNRLSTTGGARADPSLLADPTFVTALKRMAGRVESVGLTPAARFAVLDDLRELVAALERRVPRLEREGEREIARDAEALKADALRRITTLEQEPAGRSSD